MGRFPSRQRPTLSAPRLSCPAQQWFRRVDEVQKAHQCAEIRFEPDSQPSVHALVVSDYQPCQRVRWFPGATGSYWYLLARKDPHSEDFFDSDLPCPLV